MSFLGNYFHNIDSNNRLVMPSAFREEIGTEFVLFKSPDKCVNVYSLSAFDKLFEEVRSLAVDANGRNQARTFARAAKTVTQDKQGRFTIPQDYIDFADLSEGTAITGVGNRIEIWSKAEFDRQQSEEDFAPENFPSIIF